MSRDRRFMARALELASRGRGFVHPNPMVGAVIALGDEIIGEGFHGVFGGAHAEREAIRDALERGNTPKGAVIYVTLEPCAHHGKTPPCAYALIEAGLSGVVIASPDPNPLVGGAGIRALEEAGLSVEVGLMAEEERRLNRAYRRFHETGLPYLTLKLALTLDGRAAAADGSSRWITSEESRRRVDAMRSGADAVLTGIGTVLIDDPSLRVRTGGGRNPARIVLDSSARLPLESELARSAGDGKTIVVTGPGPDPAGLLEAGCRIIRAPLGPDGHLSLPEALAAVAESGFLDILIEAGPTLSAALLGEGLVKRAAFFIAPALLGREGLSGIGDLGIGSMEEIIRLKDIETERLGEDILVIGEVPSSLQG